MSDTTPCPECARPNDAGAAFCAACGASMQPQRQCPSCTSLNPIGNRFCNRCGGALEHGGWSGEAATGGVVDGVWERTADEVIRRVDPEDARRYLGTRTVRVPAGAIGAVVVDGVVERIMPPGERTTIGVFERIANFFLGRERTAFYLVDQRTFPVPFVVQTRASAAGEVIRSQVLVTFALPRGDRAALATFIANVLGPRPAFTTGELYNLVRPEVVRIAQAVLERGGPAVSYPDAEAQIRAALSTDVAPRYGLTLDATLAPLTRVVSLTVRLGAGAVPLVRACVQCRRDLPVSLAFCDACGTKQPILRTDGNAEALFTSDGEQVELDVVLRAQGQHDELRAEQVTPALAGAVASYVRGVKFAALGAVGGLTAMAQAVVEPVATSLGSLGLTVAALEIVDLRSKNGAWRLGARADLARAKEEVALGMQWLEQRDGELDLEALTLTRILRQQRLQRDQAFARDDDAMSDRERRDGLAARGAVLDVAAAQRAGVTQAAIDDVAHTRAMREAAHATELRRTRLEAELADLRARRDVELETVEKRKKLELELAALAEAQQLDKLRAMAAIEREAEAAAHAQELEKRRMLQGLSPEEMIAMQAATLAQSEGGGAAWANVLAQRASADVERRHAEDTRALLERQQQGAQAMATDAMKAMAQVASSRAEAAPVVAGASGPVVTVATTKLAPMRACPACGAGMKPDARFCGACGAKEGGTGGGSGGSSGGAPG